MTPSPTKTEQVVWEDARKLHEFHYTDLVQFGISENTARGYMRRWERWDWIRLVRTDDNKRRYFAAADRPVLEVEPVSARPTPEGNMWRAMRRLGQFSATDVAAHANAGGIAVSVEETRGYCRKLMSAEYLRVRVTAIPGRREAHYQLINDTGPRAPRTTRLQGLIDPNSNTFHPADRSIKS